MPKGVYKRKKPALFYPDRRPGDPGYVKLTQAHETYDIAKGGYVDLKAANDRIKALEKELEDAQDTKTLANTEASILRDENDLLRRIISKLLE